MRADRAREKQKLLDLLTELKLLPDWFPRDASQVPELAGELHNAIVGFLASTPSKLMVLNQEDLLKQVEQQNLPGSTARVSQLAQKDEVHRRGAVDVRRDPGLRADVSLVAGADGACKRAGPESVRRSSLSLCRADPFRAARFLPEEFREAARRACAARA